MQASRELLASRPDVWAFLAEPYHLTDWYPGVSGVTPDRRGSAAGARWRVVASNEPTLLRKPRAPGTLLVTASDPPRLFAFQLVAEKLDVRVDLAALSENRTEATVTIEGPLLITYRRTLARRAVDRLYALCQTAATL
jgi:Polyketide cyclase / dehydrase and lipid transport